MLRKLKLGPKSTGKVKAWWGGVPDLREEVGKWKHLLKQVFKAYTRGALVQPGLASQCA